MQRTWGWVAASVVAHAASVSACRSEPGAAVSSSAAATAPAAPSSPEAAAPPASVAAEPSAAPAASATRPPAAWVGTFRATTSDPHLDAERKTRHRTRHVLLAVQPDGAFRVKLTDAPVDGLDTAGGCETRGHVAEREGRLLAVEESTTCGALAALPREVPLKIERVDACTLRWVHERGGLSGGVLELGLRRINCVR